MIAIQLHHKIDEKKAMIIILVASTNVGILGISSMKRMLM
jgi:hypothetical protein